MSRRSEDTGRPDEFVTPDRENDDLEPNERELLSATSTGRAAHRRQRSGWRRAIVIMLVSGLVLGLAGAGVLWYLTERYLGNIDRVEDVFAGLDPDERPAPPSRPPGAEQDPVTFLFVGTDVADPGPGGGPGSRSDVIMLMRVTADRQHVQLVSIPRDSWVFIPDRGMGKINSAYATGGPQSLIRTVERLTQVRVDHYADMDFAGFEAITDALGGVDVNVAETVSTAGVTFTEGVNRLNGREALIYVRQRMGLPGGDLDRVQRQQNYLRSILTAALQQGLLSDIGSTDQLLRALTGSIRVDDTLDNVDILGLAYSLRGLSPGGLEFFTAPIEGLGREGDQSVVYIDTGRADRMWRYLNSDNLAAHLEEFASDALPVAPN